MPSCTLTNGATQSSRISICSYCLPFLTQKAADLFDLLPDTLSQMLLEPIRNNKSYSSRCRRAPLPSFDFPLLIRCIHSSCTRVGYIYHENRLGLFRKCSGKFQLLAKVADRARTWGCVKARTLTLRRLSLSDLHGFAYQEFLDYIQLQV